jgi:MOSC domain-containing protein YiiM
MDILSINVALPQEIEHKGNKILTSFYKQPISEPVRVLTEGLVGNDQADKGNHGGKDKAVYAYSHHHYSYWENILACNQLPYGSFGENLTINHLSEDETCIGDQFQVGEVVMAVTQPRVPCFKLGIRFDDDLMVKKFLQSARTGLYLNVLQEGMIQQGDRLVKIKSGTGCISVKSLFSAFYLDKSPLAMDVLRNVLAVDELSAEWREQINRKLWSCCEWR